MAISFVSLVDAAFVHFGAVFCKELFLLSYRIFLYVISYIYSLLSFLCIRESNFKVAGVIVGKFKHAKYDALNHAIMHAKYYVHMQFVSDNKVSWAL